jgi:hypothetical protein
MAKRKLVVKRSLTLQKSYRSWDEYTVGDIVVGEIVGWHEDNYGKKGPVVKVEEAFFKDAAAAKKATGQNLVLNSNGMLSNALKEGGIEPGDVGAIIQVEYQGKNKLTKGPYKGKDAHVVDVAIMGEEEEVSEEDDGDLL